MKRPRRMTRRLFDAINRFQGGTLLHERMLTMNARTKSDINDAHGKHAPETNGSTSVEPTAPARQHRATYARDKKKGGYIIRVEGPHADKFGGRSVPVTRRDNSESTEKLDAMLWLGVDEDSGKPVALYTFEQKPAERKDWDF